MTGHHRIIWTQCLLAILLAAVPGFCAARGAPPVAAAQISTDTLHWRPGYKLRWSDFQGTPEPLSSATAVTFSGLVPQVRYLSDSVVEVTIIAVFYRKESWEKSLFRSPEALSHEQGHFNITEVFARRATAAFRQYKYNRKTVQEDLNGIFDTFVREKNETQQRYDDETSCHRNEGKQREWDRRIAEWLSQSPQPPSP
jgi:hypothetical protein